MNLLLLEYLKIYIYKNSDDFWHDHPNIMQFDWFLSVLTQKWLGNHELYYLACIYWVTPEIRDMRISPRVENL